MSALSLRIGSRATGPGRFRRDLRTLCAHLINQTTRSAGLTRASTQLPASVLGGDLLAALSDSLRVLLNDGRTDLSPGRARVPETPPRERESGPTTRSSVAPGQAEHPLDLGDVLRSPAGRREREWLKRSTVVAPRLASKAERTSVLTNRIHEYERLTRSPSSSKPLPEHPETSPGQRKSPPQLERPGGRGLRTLPTSSSLAEGLLGFVDGGPFGMNGSADREAAPPRPMPNGRCVDWPAGTDPARVAWLPDFSERMADVLRMQALEHGIDLT